MSPEPESNSSGQAPPYPYFTNRDAIINHLIGTEVGYQFNASSRIGGSTVS
ncbi:MAG: hypothetical protein IT285_12485 [Bdellovibrionales bacterium]|nr:hypothetical protein [Bdellovibrionales bacterium]